MKSKIAHNSRAGNSTVHKRERRRTMYSAQLHECRRQAWSTLDPTRKPPVNKEHHYRLMAKTCDRIHRLRQQTRPWPECRRVDKEEVTDVSHNDRHGGND